MRSSSPKRQQGIVLLIGLIFLVLLTLMAVAAFNIGKSDFMVVSNMQIRKESLRAAEQVLDEVITNTAIDLTKTTDIFGLGTMARDIDINGTGTRNVTVTVAAPSCVKVQSIKQSALNMSNSNDLPCARSVDQGAGGVEGASTGDSLCSDVTWEVKATAVEALSSASATVVQGIGQRATTTKISLVCS